MPIETRCAMKRCPGRPAELPPSSYHRSLLNPLSAELRSCPRPPPPPPPTAASKRSLCAVPAQPCAAAARGSSRQRAARSRLGRRVPSRSVSALRYRNTAHSGCGCGKRGAGGGKWMSRPVVVAAPAPVLQQRLRVGLVAPLWIGAPTDAPQHGRRAFVSPPAGNRNAAGSLSLGTRLGRSNRALSRTAAQRSAPGPLRCSEPTKRGRGERHRDRSLLRIRRSTRKRPLDRISNSDKRQRGSRLRFLPPSPGI